MFSSNIRLLVFTTVSLFAWGTAAFAQAQPRQLSLADCLQLAEAQNHDFRITQEEQNGALASRRAIAGNFGPKINIDANILRWDGPLEMSLGSFPGMTIPPMTTREDVTKSLSLSIIQPLTPLWSIYEGYKVQDLGVDVAKIKLEATRRDVSFQVIEGYFRILQAMRLVEVGQASVEQLTAQVQRARVFEKNGMVSRNDVLRAELGLAAAKQKLIQSKGQLTLAQSSLALQLGLSPATEIVPQDEPRVYVSVEEIDDDQAMRRVIRQRLELRQLATRIEQTKAGTSAAWSKMIPQVSAMANYSRATGSKFQPEESYYVGLAAQWNVWEWGASYYGTVEAKSREQQTLLAYEKVKQALQLDARAAQVKLRTAQEALLVAKQAVTQAEENFRLEQKRYEAHANTSFDVIDAESQLTQARAMLHTATYDHLIARAGLARALGEPISPSAVDSAS